MQSPVLPTGWAVSQSEFSPVLDLNDLARLLHRERNTLKADRCRAPGRVPPACKIPGTKDPLWILPDVLDWLRQHPESESGSHKVGRPNKVDQVRRQQEGVE